MGRSAGASGEAAKDAGDVAVESGGGLAEGNAGDGPSSVVADAGQLVKGDGIGRQFAAREADDGLGEGVEETGAAVVAESLPRAEDAGEGGAGEAGPIREGPHPAEIVRNDSGDAGLLAHELRHGGAIGGGAGAPGQGAAVFLVPGVEAGEGPADFGFDGGGRGSSVEAHGGDNVYP